MDIPNMQENQALSLFANFESSMSFQGLSISMHQCRDVMALVDVDTHPQDLRRKRREMHPKGVKNQEPVMKVHSVLALGFSSFLSRHRGLLTELQAPCLDVNCLAFGDYLSEGRVAKSALRAAQAATRRIISPKLSDFIFLKNYRAFEYKSRKLESILQERRDFDCILQFFAMFRPYYAQKPNFPIFLVLDYTMAMAVRNWPSWAPFLSPHERQKWLSLETETYSAARHVFAMSRAVRDSLIEDYGVPTNKVTVIGSAPNIASASIQPVVKRKNSLLMNGSDFIRKGVDIAVDAMSILRSKIPSATLTIVGGTKRIKSNGVIDLGQISNQTAMAKLLHESSIVVAPARCDPFPTFLIEAQYYGLPVIASPRDGMPEIVSDGVSGLIMKTLDPEELASNAEQLLLNPAMLKEMSVNAHSRAASHFNWNVIAPRIRNIILECLADYERSSRTFSA